MQPPGAKVDQVGTKLLQTWYQNIYFQLVPKLEDGTRPLPSLAQGATRKHRAPRRADTWASKALTEEHLIDQDLVLHRCDLDRLEKKPTTTPRPPSVYNPEFFSGGTIPPDSLKRRQAFMIQQCPGRRSSSGHHWMVPQLRNARAGACVCARARTPAPRHARGERARRLAGLQA